jgi:hypothetical protein
VPVSPVGNGLVLRAQAYRTSLGVVGSGLFWLVGTAERHDGLDADCHLAPHPPAHAGAAGAGGRDQLPPRHGKLHADRHARAGHARPHHLRERRVLPDDRLERSRTGGPEPPFPYWPEEDHESLHAKLRTNWRQAHAGGFQVRVKRKNGTLFDARLYVSPLIDAHGQQTGWMTSMTDITEPNRIREQLTCA